MDALTKLQAQAGQKVHELRYDGRFLWAGLDLPCTHGEFGVNPVLSAGGLSPASEVLVVVRSELFQGTDRPAKLQPCKLRMASGRMFDLKVEAVMSGAGDVLQKFLCKDFNEGA